MAEVKAATVDERTHELWSFKDAAKLDDEANAAPQRLFSGACARARARTIEGTMQHARTDSLTHSLASVASCYEPLVNCQPDERTDTQTNKRANTRR